VTPRFRGVVFDLDGTLVDNLGFHVEAFALFVRRHGLPPMDHAMRGRLDGKRNRDIFPILLGRPLDPTSFQRFEDEKEGLYRELSRGRLQPLPGLGRLLDLLEARGIGAAVATSAPAANVDHTLEELGLSRRFRAVVRGDQVPHGKPAPDVFLEAARQLGVPAAACLAFEDAPAGVSAAKAANMTCIALTTSFTPEEFAANGARPDAALPNFESFLSSWGDRLAEGTVATLPR